MINIYKYTKTCNACPAQWECWTDDNKYVYIRYRLGFLRVSIHKNEEEYWDQTKDVVLFCEKVGRDYDGFMTDEEMKEFLKGLLNFNDALIINYEN
jgi:hypothetical protein